MAPGGVVSKTAARINNLALPRQNDCKVLSAGHLSAVNRMYPEVVDHLTWVFPLGCQASYYQAQGALPCREISELCVRLCTESYPRNRRANLDCVQENFCGKMKAVCRDSSQLEHVSSPGPEACSLCINEHLPVILLDIARVISFQRAPVTRRELLVDITIPLFSRDK